MPDSAPTVARGLEGVVATQTRLSHVDGQAGELTLAGFPLQALASQATFEEMLFLLWHDRLPTAAELSALRSELAASRSLPAATETLLDEAARRQVPAMDALRMGADTLSLADPTAGEAGEAANLRRAKAIVAAFPTIVAGYWRRLQEQAPVEPSPDLSHASNYLYMLFGDPPHPEAARGLETYLNTVIDHGMNNSTFAARVIISSGTDIYSAVVGAIGALKGPLHGGAPGPALDMVFQLRERARQSGCSLQQETEAHVREVVAKDGRIMGFGHRIYKVRDPRADVLGVAARRLFQRAGDEALYADALAVEEVVLRVLSELKPGRNLSTNVEFYTALILHGLGLQLALFTPTFAVARVGGWSGHILEQMQDGRIFRPRSAYVGGLSRQWVSVEERS
jgi:citrate synthase